MDPKEELRKNYEDDCDVQNVYIKKSALKNQNIFFSDKNQDFKQIHEENSDMIGGIKKNKN